MRPTVNRAMAMTAQRSVAAEGTRAGSYAASGVAVGFLVADAMHGMPFVTPQLLGGGVASVLGLDGLASSPTALVVGYTLLHYAAFALLGILAAAVIRVARRDTSVLAGALLVFAIVEVAFAGLVALLHATTTTGTMTWIQLVGGNVVGCALLALVLRRDHPELRSGFEAGVRGTGAWAVR